MSIGVLFLVQILFLILQVVLSVSSFALDKPILLYVSYLCCVVVLYLMFAILLNYESVIMIYVLVGQTNSGKSTLARDLVTVTGIKQIINYTTRPMRQGERDGIDYHFITNGEMNSGGFFGRRDFYTVYRDEPYSYAMKEDDFILLDDALVILDPKGVRELKDHIGYENITVVYINASEELIKERASKRGDKVDE